MLSDLGHFVTFKKIRHDHNEGPCNETNKLVLKLDELLQAGQNLAHTPPVVGWAPDDEVKLCPYCAKSFNVSRRRHHCRTCGAILCNTCSHFITKIDADHLVRPRKLVHDEPEQSESLVNGDKTNDEKLDRIRLCEDCDRLLKRRLQTIEDHYYRPEFCEYYDEMRAKIRQIDELAVTYELMCDSLHCGDDVYKLTDANELKAKIDKLKEKILPLTKRMISTADHNAYAIKQLLASVHESVVHWLRTKMISLPSVPSEAEYEKLRTKRRSELMSDGDSFVENSRSSLNLNRSMTRATEPSGWVPEQPIKTPVKGPNGEDEADDENPLLIQIRMLDEYIRQARLANRYEEVSSLEASKRDLEIELQIGNLSI